MRIPTAAAVASAAVVLTSATGVAWGTWTTTALGDAGAISGSLAAPSGTGIRWDPVVHLSWTPSPPSTPGWAGGQRVLRAVAPGGPWTQLGGTLGATATTYDDAPGAGTFHYAVQTVGASWSSALSPLMTRADAKYVLTASAPPGGTGCSTGMQQGFVPVGVGANAVAGSTTFLLCTDPWTSGQSLPAGTTTIALHAENSHKSQACSVDVSVTAGGTSLSGGVPVTHAVPAGAVPAAAVVWAVPTAAASFVSGDRLVVTLTARGGGGCASTRIHLGSPGYPSSVTLPG